MRANCVLHEPDRKVQAENQSETLHGLAERVARLIPSRRDPEQFFLEKDDIAHQLRRLALEGGR